MWAVFPQRRSVETAHERARKASASLGDDDRAVVEPDERREAVPEATTPFRERQRSSGLQRRGVEDARALVADQRELVARRTIELGGERPLRLFGYDCALEGLGADDDPRRTDAREQRTAPHDVGREEIGACEGDEDQRDEDRRDHRDQRPCR